MIRIQLIHGPNLNLLGKREPEIYETLTLKCVNDTLYDQAKSLNVQLDAFQNNSESMIIDKIHQCIGQVDGIIINPAALTHTSVALRDALIAVSIPFIEIHLSNIHAREDFRKHSYLADKAIGVIYGFGAGGYSLALQAMAEKLKQREPNTE